MKEYIIKNNEAGQRFDKFLAKVLPEASMGFIFKMLRKKNFVLNDKKADGKEILKQGDHVKIYLSDDTFLKFSTSNQSISSNGDNQYPKVSKADLEKLSLTIVYEDDDILIFNKPAGMLSQKAKPEDVSVNEYLIGYLLTEKVLTTEDLKTFKPSVSNRLDRNTTGAILCGKSLKGLQYLSAILKDRTAHKYYKTIVYGNLSKRMELDGYLAKNERTNVVTIQKTANNNVDLDYIKTVIDPISHYKYKGKDYTEVEVLLVTGKTHQIRAHLASVGHPLIGDYKYGDWNKKGNPFPIKYQLLHAYKMVFPHMADGADAQLMHLSDQTFYADLSKEYIKILRILQNGNME